MKILVVDDDRRMVKTICDILKVKGYSAAPAFTGEEAVRMVTAERPDCVLMDIRMPGIDGIKALKMMKELSPDLHVVLMSAYATNEQAEEAKSQGACAILTKPINFSHLLTFLSLLGKEECIIVVDDDPQFCSLLKDALIARNYRVEAEYDPVKVLSLMDLEYALAVILDIRLHGANGVDMLQNIRMRYPSKPVILVTGYRETMAASIQRGLRIGAYTCLYKPFKVEELIAILDEIKRKKYRELLGGPFCADGT